MRLLKSFIQLFRKTLCVLLAIPFWVFLLCIPVGFASMAAALLRGDIEWHLMLGISVIVTIGAGVAVWFLLKLIRRHRRNISI